MLLFPSGPSSHNYLFIDGECFRRILLNIGERYFGGSTPPLDWDKISYRFRKVYYYDAIPIAKKENESREEFEKRRDAKRSELQKIQSLPKFHVKTGEVRRENKARGSEQKMVDVQLAVDALQMAARGLFGQFSLIAADLDFLPLIAALVDMGVDVELLYAHNKTVEDLRDEADRATSLNIHTIRPWLNSDFRKLEELPQFRLTQPNLDGARVLQTLWHDVFGQVIFYLNNGKYCLSLSNAPAPGDYRSVITSTHQYDCREENVLVKYAKDGFNLDLNANGVGSV